MFTSFNYTHIHVMGVCLTNFIKMEHYYSYLFVSGTKKSITYQHRIKKNQLLNVRLFLIWKGQI